MLSIRIFAYLDLEFAHAFPSQYNCSSTVAKMNDPGLDEPIQAQSKKVEKERKDEEEFQKEDEQAFLDPRYFPYCPVAIDGGG